MTEPLPTADVATPTHFGTRWAGRLAAIALGLLLALALAEALTRLFAPHPRYPDFIVPDPRVGHLPLPDYRGRATNMFGEFDSVIRTNHEGFRDRDHPLAKTDGTVRLAFLGDSFTFAEQVDESQSFVRRTEALLGGAPGAPRVECLNFGVGGDDTYHELLRYEHFARKYRPDLVVLAVYVHNDLLGNAFYLLASGTGRPHFRLENGRLRFAPANSSRQEAARGASLDHGMRWYQRLQCYNALQQLLWEVRQRAKRDRETKEVAAGIVDPWSNEAYRNYRYFAQGRDDPVVREADEISRLLLRRLEEEVRADGGRLLVVLLPAAENLFPERWSEHVKLLPALRGLLMDFDRPFRLVPVWLPDLAASGRILDLRPALRSASSEGKIFFPRDSHYNRRGQEAVAQALAPWLRPFLVPTKP
ncbi:MAG: alginate O-acetyltransferase AlgX-related protein [Verrucomicrobiia bacterium]